MKTAEWKTYRTRFLVKAKQLNCNLSFTDPLGRQHSGRKGDYLVESFDGVLSIAPRHIFEDIYVSMNSQRVGDPISLAAHPHTDTDIRRKQPQPSHVRRTPASGTLAH